MFVLWLFDLPFSASNSIMVGTALNYFILLPRVLKKGIRLGLLGDLSQHLV